MPPPKETRSKLQKLKFALGQSRRQVDDALEVVNELESDLDPKYLLWKCDGCGYRKHFTRPSTVAACGSCPRCGGPGFSPGEK
jgi:rubrerythrin